MESSLGDGRERQASPQVETVEAFLPLSLSDSPAVTTVVHIKRRQVFPIFVSQVSTLPRLRC